MGLGDVALIIGGIFGLASLVAIVCAQAAGGRKERDAAAARAAESRVETLIEVKEHETDAARQSDDDLVRRLSRDP